ncbi:MULTISPECIES: hypothetical protein [Acinetobacter]|uniref:hypothetical protein n=1 Tax=Acinetobacter TaxID=469 RepID=UPI000EA23F98|nr:MULTISPECIES: hypothetical protein [Acinetobacter]RKG45141.1 hypothetical protein D7V51_05765 [Acinetobacter cumulans]RZG60121.1 hypothetical protein EXE29_06365 [Acinetobacter sp. WCHAc060006]
MLDAYFDYQFSNLISMIVFMGMGVLAYKTDIVKDILALFLIALLMLPVPCVMFVHYSKNNWFEFVFCGVLQIGLTFLCFMFIKYMYEYHKKNKYIFWE